MTVFNEPTKWQTSLVNSGDANVIPQSTPAGTGKASFKDGFPQITQIPLSAGGIAPDRKDFNGLFKLLADWLFYIQNGGVPTYNPLYDYVEGRIVLHTDNNIYVCIQNNGSSNPKPPTNSAYWTKIPTLSDFDEISFKTGDIKIHTMNTVPNGWLLCNGAGVSRTTFSALFAKIGTNFGRGDGSTTFNIPDLRDRYIIGANTNVLGTYIAEQLPNITGRAQFRQGANFDVYAGAMTWTTEPDNTNTVNVTTSSSNPRQVNFDANRSNSVYTDSGKVYPLSLALNFIIKT